MPKNDNAKKGDNTGKTPRESEKKAKRKLIPAFFMLAAGASAAILMLIGGYELRKLLLNLFLVMLVFYNLGCILKYTLDRIDIQNNTQEPEEGEVIEKTPEEPDKTTAEAAEQQ